MSFLMLLPGLFELIEKVVGPLVDDAKGKVASGVLGLAKSAGLDDIMGIITGVLGKVDDLKLAQLKAGVQLALEQAALDAQEANDPRFFFSGWRPTLAWVCVAGVFVNTLLLWLVHVVLYVLALCNFNPQTLSYASSFIPMVDMGLIGSLLVQMMGLSWQVGVRTFEKNNNLHNKH